MFDKLKVFMGIEEVDDEDDDYEDENVKAVNEEKRPSADASARPSYERPAAIRAPLAPDTARPKDTVKPVPAKVFTNQFKLVVIEPQDFNDSPRLVDSLKAKKPVIINLENLETDVARKIFDFLSGATYALNGNVQKVANNIFVFAPENVDVSYNMNQKKAEDTSYKSPWSR